MHYISVGHFLPIGTEVLIFGICQLGVGALCGWLQLWWLGYHGVFALIAAALWLVGYGSCWELYGIWAGGASYAVQAANWLELGNHILVDLALVGDVLSLALLMVMAWGSAIVAAFVYVEMWDDKEGAGFLLLLAAFLFFMGLLAAAGNLAVFFLGWEGIGLVSLFLINF